MQPNQFRHWAQVLAPHANAFCAAAGAVAGAGLFFGFPVEPPLWLALFLAILAVASAVLAQSKALWGMAVFCLFAATTFLLAFWQIQNAHPVNYEKGRKPHWLVGTIEELYIKPDNPKRTTLRLKDVELYGLGPEHAARASIGVYTNQIEGLAIGQGVAVQAVLLAPEPPKFPNQRDGRLWRYLQDGRITGYIMGGLEETEINRTPTLLEKLGNQTEALRTTINQATKGMAGGAVTALLTGDERWVTPEVNKAYRNAGLSHLLAISGMQLTLVGLGLFGIIAYLLAWVPNLALYLNIRAVAAVLAMGGVVFYTFLAGASISLVRATVMSLLVLLAIATGRMGSSLRAWCLAVILILLVNPAMVMRAGFQLSAVAVLGLLLLVMAEPPSAYHPKWKKAATGLILATVVAGALTAPIVAANFGQFNVVGLLGNMLAVPVMTLATYLGMAALALWPVGLQQWPLAGMEAVVNAVNLWALWLNNLGWASVNVPPASAWLLAPLGIATVVAVLLRQGAWAFLAVALTTLCGIAAATSLKQPDVWVWNSGKIGLVRAGEDTYRVAWMVDNPKDIEWMARSSGLRLITEGEPSRVVDEQLMPVTSQETFAWAAKTAGQWQVQPVKCGRIWQKLAEACQQE